VQPDERSGPDVLDGVVVEPEGGQVVETREDAVWDEIEGVVVES